MTDARPAASPLPAPTAARLQALRVKLAQRGGQAALIPSSDPHLSEYLPERWQARVWLSGFTGSSGTLLVSAGKAAVFTDSRYWEQAETELAGSGVDLVKLDGPAVPAYVQWLLDQADVNVPGQAPVLAVDGAIMGMAQTQALRDALQAKGWALHTADDVVDGIWPDRPGLPSAPVYEHAPPYAVVSRSDKLKAMRQAMQDKGATHHWLATLDDLAWALNLRGADVDYNPVFLGHALISLDAVKLFVAAGKIDTALQAKLALDGVTVCAYADALPAMQGLPLNSALLIDPKRITWGLREAVPEGVKVIETINPSTLAKSRKTEAEAAFIREAMERDGAAMCAFYAWMEQALGHEYVSELTIDEKLSAERAKQPGYVSLSFPTIAGFNANGALPHYRVSE